jgi:IclR family transcriptional regulator, acetate operon repressor
MAGNSGEPGRTVTSKLAAILTAFTSGRDHTLSEVTMQTDLAVSTVHRLLNDLVRTTLLERPDGVGYQPGPALRGLAFEVKPSTLHARAPFVVEDVAAALRSTVRLGVVHGVEVSFVEKKAGSEPGTLFPNPARLPLHATAMGKALLAFGPRPLLQLVSGCDLTRYTSRTLVCPTELERVLHQTRARGFAVADGELQSAVRAVAVPVFDVRGRPIAAIEVDVSGPVAAAVELTVPALLTAARCLRRELAPPARHGRPVARTQGATDPLLMRA